MQFDKGEGVYIVIDGCNVLRSGGDARPVGDVQKKDFIARLGSYARLKKHIVTVVFDGGFASRPEYYTEAGVTIWHSGYDYSADDVVKRLVKEASYPFETLVVSSDRELNDCAERHNIVSIDSVVFKKFLQQALSMNDKRIGKKETSEYVVYGSYSAELDELMMLGAQNVVDKDAYNKKNKKHAVPAFSTEARIKGRYKGKIERRLERILEKL